MALLQFFSGISLFLPPYSSPQASITDHVGNIVVRLPCTKKVR